jgi:hypothetical protein
MRVVKKRRTEVWSDVDGKGCRQGLIAVFCAGCAGASAVRRYSVRIRSCLLKSANFRPRRKSTEAVDIGQRDGKHLVVRNVYSSGHFVPRDSLASAAAHAAVDAPTHSGRTCTIYLSCRVRM